MTGSLYQSDRCCQLQAALLAGRTAAGVHGGRVRPGGRAAADRPQVDASEVLAEGGVAEAELRRAGVFGQLARVFAELARPLAISGGGADPDTVRGRRSRGRRQGRCLRRRHRIGRDQGGDSSDHPAEEHVDPGKKRQRAASDHADEQRILLNPQEGVDLVLLGVGQPVVVVLAVHRVAEALAGHVQGVQRVVEPVLRGGHVGVACVARALSSPSLLLLLRRDGAVATPFCGSGMAFALVCVVLGRVPVVQRGGGLVAGPSWSGGS